MLGEFVLTHFRNYNHPVWFYGLSALTSLAISLALLYSSHFHLSLLANYAQNYGQDTLAHAALVKNFIEHGFSFENPMLGAPLKYDLSDYPFSDNATLIILKLLSFISNNFIVVMNLFFLFTFPFTALISLFVFQYLGLNKPFAFAASLLFAFLPYHFFRLEEGHLFLIAYYVIPIYVLFIFSVLGKPLPLGKNHVSAKTKSPKKYLLFTAYFVACLFAASSGVYYAFFACCLLLFAGIIASIDKMQWRPLIHAMIIVLAISSTLLLNALPSITSKVKQGSNLEVWQRTPFESELYGLKITQLLLPIDKHQVKPLASFKESYDSTAPLINENRYASLGIISSIGFLLLLVTLIFRRFSSNNKTLYDLSRLNIATILFGTVGGFSAVFAYLGSPTIRAYNRLSVFIAFFSLAGLFLILQTILKNQPARHKGGKLNKLNKTGWIIALLLIPIGIIDQFPHTSFSAGKNTFENDAKFIAAIEAKMPPGAMIMQLPVVEFPESPGLQKLGSYDLLRGYLHSHQLHWSFGAMRGRAAALWQNEIARKPIQKMLNDLVYAGFTGIYIDRKGYADNGKNVEKQLTRLLDAGPTFVSENRELAFYDLTPYIEELRESMSSSAWQTHENKVMTALGKLGNLQTSWINGLYQLEHVNNTNWHWSKQKSSLVINIPYHTTKVKIKFHVKTGYPEYSNLQISGDLLRETIKVNQNGQTIERELIIPKGIHHIYFKSDAKQIDAPGDLRQLFFAIYDFAMVEDTQFKVKDNRTKMA